MRYSLISESEEDAISQRFATFLEGQTKCHVRRFHLTVPAEMQYQCTGVFEDAAFLSRNWNAFGNDAKVYYHKSIRERAHGFLGTLLYFLNNKLLDFLEVVASEPVAISDVYVHDKTIGCRTHIGHMFGGYSRMAFIEYQLGQPETGMSLICNVWVVQQ